MREARFGFEPNRVMLRKQIRRPATGCGAEYWPIDTLLFQMVKERLRRMRSIAREAAT